MIIVLVIAMAATVDSRSLMSFCARKRGRNNCLSSPYCTYNNGWCNSKQKKL